MKKIINSHHLVNFETPQFISAIKSDFGFDISEVEKIEQGYASQVYKVMLEGKEAFIKINENPEVFPVEVLGYSILKELGVPAPSVIDQLDHPGTIGYSTIILSGAEGTQLARVHLDQEQEESVYMQMGEILKRIHEVKLEGFGRLVVEEGRLRGKFGSWAELLASLQKRYEDDLEIIKERGFLTEKELEILDEARKEIALVDIKQGSLIHTDLHHGHVFVTGDKVTGVIDLGVLAVGDPRYDIAKSLVFQNPKQQESFKKGYGELANDPLVNNYLLYFAARKIVFRHGVGKKDGVETAITVFRQAVLNNSK